MKKTSPYYRTTYDLYWNQEKDFLLGSFFTILGTASGVIINERNFKERYKYFRPHLCYNNVKYCILKGEL